MMKYLLALPWIAAACPLAAQDHDHSAMEHPAPSAPAEQDAPAAMDHGTMDHSGMDHEMPAPAAPTQPPARAFEGPQHAADIIWGEAAMAPARQSLARENGAFRTGSVMAERLEARLGDEDVYLWDIQAFYGGDLDRLVIKSEGEGEFGGALDDAEVQALWSHAIGPFVDLQAGARLDLEPDTRSHLVVGVQGLAPYMWHFDAAAFLSDQGDLTARIEAEYDQRITQRLILQPRVEFDLAAQDIPRRDIGAGLVSIEAGLRLRYEITREFAPYVGLEWEQKLGETRDIVHAKGEDPSGVAILLGIRSWF